MLSSEACSVAPEEDAPSADVAALVTPVWTQAEARSDVQWTVHGSGEVPVGSQCAPGTAIYALESSPHALWAQECVGAPLRFRQRRVPLTPEQYTAIVVAARAVTHSEATSCSALPTPNVKMIVNDLDTRESVVVRSDRFACDGQGGQAKGIEAVLDIVTPIVAAAPRPTPAVYGGPEPTRFWSTGARAFRVNVAGSGPTPVGSGCVPGGVEYILYLQDDDVKLDARRCVISEQGRLVERSRGRLLSEEEAKGARAALRSANLAPRAQCSPQKPYTTAVVHRVDDSGASYSDRFTDVHSACVLGADDGPYVDLGSLAALFERLSNG